MLVFAPLVILGAPAWAIFWYSSFIGILGVIGHSNALVRLPSAAHRLVMTPHFPRTAVVSLNGLGNNLSLVSSRVTPATGKPVSV